MKKFFILIFISLLNFSNSFGDLLSNDKNKMTLFGIALDSNEDLVESTPCYKYEDMLNVKRLDLMEFEDKRDWKTLIYTESKIPVAKGCVKPLIKNDDFFNFYIRVYPKSKEIYEISAIYKKTFIYSDRDLVLGGANRTDKEIKDLKTLMNTKCEQLSKTLKGIVYDTHKKKGFKNYDGVMIKGGNYSNAKYRFKIDSWCGENGARISFTRINKLYNPGRKRTYFVTIKISNRDYGRVVSEEYNIKNEAIKKDLNKSGL